MNRKRTKERKAREQEYSETKHENANSTAKSSKKIRQAALVSSSSGKLQHFPTRFASLLHLEAEKK